MKTPPTRSSSARPASGSPRSPPADASAPIDDAEPVSLRELELIVAPGSAPPPLPARLGAASARSSHGASLPAPKQAASTAGAPPVRSRPKPPTRAVPTPPIPEARPALGAVERAPDSGLVDVREMASVAPPAPKDHRIDDDVAFLSGGLFDDARRGSRGALAPPDITPLPVPSPSAEAALAEGSLAPTAAPVAVPTSPQLTEDREPPPRGAMPVVEAPPARTAPSLAPEPHRAVGGRRPALWMLAVAAAGVIGWLALRPSRESAAPASPAREAAPATERAEVADPPAPMAPTETIAPKLASAEPGPSSAAANGPGALPSQPEAQVSKRAKTGRSSSGAAEPRARADVPAEADTPAAPRVVEAAPPAAAPAPSPAVAGGAAFDTIAASAALTAVGGTASGCRAEGDPAGVARVSVTFAPSGRVTSSNVSGPPFAGTKTGGCIARSFKSATVPPFEGGPVTVSKTVNIQ